MQSIQSDISEHPLVLEIIQNALREDIGDGDHSSASCISPEKTSEAELIIKEAGIIAGISIAEKILKLNDPECQVLSLVEDGDSVQTGQVGMKVSGNSRALLKSERLLLNIMQRLSGIATTTHQAVKLLEGCKTKVLDTRKTTPNLRILEKWAVTVGGGVNHRFGLYDMIMLKDNHVDVAGGIDRAISLAHEYLKNNNLDLGIEVETRNLEEVKQVLESLPVQRIMLDNYTPEATQEAVLLINGRCETESSGGINLSNIRKYAEAGVDYISLGMLTHSVKSMDISFKIKL